MIALREQPRVELAEQRAEPVRIVERARRAVRVRDAQAVTRRSFDEVRFEQPGVACGLGFGEDAVVVVDDGERARTGDERAHDGAGAELVRAEHGERIALATVLDRGDGGRQRSRAA